MIHRIHHAVRITLFVLLILLAVGLTSTRLIFLLAPGYKHAIEEKVAELTEMEVSIGSFRADFRGINPEFILQEIQVASMDTADESAIQLNELRLGLNLVELIFSGDVLASSWLSLVGVQVSVIQYVDGRIAIRGLPSGDDEYPLWLLRGGKYEILNSELHWYQEDQEHPVVFSELNFLIKNDGWHEIHLTTQLPDQFGRALRVSANVQGDVLDMQATHGQAYLDFEHLQIPALAELIDSSKIKIEQGQANGKVWLQWRQAAINSVTADIDISSLKSSVENNTQQHFDRVKGAFSAQQNDAEWQFSIHELALQSGEKHWLPASLSLAQDTEKNIAGNIKQLDLDIFNQLKAVVNPVAELPDWIANVELKGQLRNLRFFGNQENQQLALRGDFDQLGFKNALKEPWAEGLTGSVEGSQHIGELRLNSDDGVFYLPSVFRKPVAVERLAGNIQWQKHADVYTYRSNLLELDTLDLSLRSRLEIRVPSGDESPVADVQIQFAGRDNIKFIPRILPARQMGSKAVRWMDRAFVDGRIKDGHVLFNGRVDEYPFTHSDGSFEAFFTIDKGTLSFNDAWPSLQNYQAFLHVVGDTLTIDFAHAEAHQVTVDNARIVMPSVDRADVLFINSQLHGDIRNVLTYLYQSPLQDKVSGVYNKTMLTGDTQIALDMEIPLSDDEDIVKGVARLTDAKLKINAIDLDFDKLQGELHFSQNGISAESMTARGLGFPVQGNIVTEPDATVVHVTGTTSSRHIQQHFSFLQNTFSEGEFDYLAKVRFPDQDNLPTKVKINTNGKGLKIDLPGQLAKAQEDIGSMQLDIELPENAPSVLHFNYRQHLDINLLLDSQTGAIDSGHVVYGTGKAMADGSHGLAVDVIKPEVDLTAWLPFIMGRKETEGQKGVAVNKVKINVDQLLINSQSVGQVELAMQKLEQAWQGNIQHEYITGAFNIAAKEWASQKSVLTLSTLDLTGLSEIKWDDEEASASVIPLFDLTADKVLWQGADLGKLKMTGQPEENGVSFKGVTLNNQLNTINMDVEWVHDKTGATQTRFNADFSSTDFGRFLGQFKLNDDLKETLAWIKFTGGWQGGLHDFTLEGLNADMRAELEGGRISSIEPGIGRLLGLVAFDQWIKRLTLDFSDLYRKGLAYHTVKGDFHIEQGKATTENLMLDALPANIKIMGVTDLINKTVDYDAIVVPKSADAVPIASTIVGEIASLLTRAVTDQYKEGYFFGSEYKMQGSWGDIKITQLQQHDGILKKTWRGLTEFPWVGTKPQPDKK